MGFVNLGRKSGKEKKDYIYILPLKVHTYIYMKCGEWKWHISTLWIKKEVVCCLLKISTVSEAFVSSWRALLEWQARLTFLECMTSFKCQETFLWPPLSFAIGSRLFTTHTAPAWLAVTCGSHTSTGMKQKPCFGSLPHACQESFPPAAPLQETGKQAGCLCASILYTASRLPLCLHPLPCGSAAQHFTSQWKGCEKQEHISHSPYHNWTSAIAERLLPIRAH